MARRRQRRVGQRGAQSALDLYRAGSDERRIRERRGDLPLQVERTGRRERGVAEDRRDAAPDLYGARRRERRTSEGGIVGIYVARDVDFSSVYELKPTASAPAREGTP